MQNTVFIQNSKGTCLIFIRTTLWNPFGKWGCDNLISKPTGQNGRKFGWNVLINPGLKANFPSYQEVCCLHTGQEAFSPLQDIFTPMKTSLVRNIPPDLKRTIQIIWSETFHTNLEKVMNKQFRPLPVDSASAGSAGWSACPPYWTSFKNERSAAFGGFALARLFILVRLDRPNIA